MRQNHAMKSPSTFRTILRRAGPPAASLIVMAFFGGYAVLGPNGLLAYGKYQQQVAERTALRDQLRKERATLQNRVDLLDPRHTSQDLAEELVMKRLKLADPNDVIMPQN